MGTKLDDLLKQKAEIEKQISEFNKLNKPEPVKNPNFNNLIEQCVDYIDQIEEHEWIDSDWSHYVTEEALKAVFGKDIYEWINKKRK